MSFKPKTIRRSPSSLRAYMRSYNDLAKGLRALRKLIEAEVKLSVSRRKLIKRVKSEADEAEDLFNE